VASESGAETPEPRIRARRLRAIAPRFDAVVVIPRALLGLDQTLAGAPLTLDVAVVGFLRGRAFTLSGRPLARVLADPPSVPAALAPTPRSPSAPGD
jgi:hypothetical protein